MAEIVTPVPAYCSRCYRPLRGLYRLVEEKAYCFNCYNLLKKVLDEDLLRILWKYADEKGKISLEKQKELIDELTRLLGRVSTVFNRLEELEKRGLLKLPDRFRGSIYSQMLCVLETYAVDGKVEGENFKLALRELANRWSSSIGWIKYMIRSLEEMGLVRLHIHKFNRLVGVTLLPGKSEAIELLTDIGRPKPVSVSPRVYVIKSGGKEYHLMERKSS